jgi:hypothetical protein
MRANLPAVALFPGSLSLLQAYITCTPGVSCDGCSKA